MKRSVVILVVCLVAFAIAFAEADKRTFLAKNDRDRQAAFASFKSFVEQHKKDYKTIEEFQERFTIFSQNLARIDELNKKSESARFGITPFADLTPLEFKNKYLSKVPAIPDPSLPVAADLDTSNLPESWDWREKGAVTPVKNQGQCGSCWSFSTTGNVEGQWYLAGNPLTSLSEQNLVDCDHECMMYEGEESCDSGCNGGLQPNAYNYIIKNGGIDTEEAYPYTAQDGTCKFTASKIGAKIDNFTMISQDEDQIAAYLVAHGPLAIAADAVEWQFYVGGVFDLPCSKNLDHGILIVGYGVSDDGVFARRKPYWIIKNSWGTAWGEKGYMRIHRGVGKCGLNTFVSSAIINKD